MSHKDIETRRGLSSTSSTIDIVTVPWHFLATKYDHIEQLFLPMVAFAQQAKNLQGELPWDAQTAAAAATSMAGELLRDTTFAPVRSLAVNAANTYLIDFANDLFQVECTICTEAVFRVKVVGTIRGDHYDVTDPVTGGSLFSFTTIDAGKTDFFPKEFPLLAQQSRKNPAMFTGTNVAFFHGTIEITLGIPVGGETIMVQIYKGSDTTTAEVKNPISDEFLMSLPIAALGNLHTLIGTIAQHLTLNPLARVAQKAASDR